MTYKNPEKIKEMFNSIANRYDFINGIISFGTHRYGKKQAIKDLPVLPHDAEILDLCTGTGDLAFFLKNSGHVTGLDFSKNMLALASKKVPEVRFVEGDCTHLPFEDETFDLVTMGFGLRNIENSDLALDEIVRVLKPEGLFLHLDFSKTNPAGDFVFDRIVPFLVRIFYNNTVPYNYLVKSKQEYFNPQELVEKFQFHGLKYVTQKYYSLGMMCATVMKRQTTR